MKPQGQHNGGSLARAIDWLVDDTMFADLSPHGNTKWTFVPLVTLALCWAWGSETGLAERFQSGLKSLARWFPRSRWGRT